MQRSKDSAGTHGRAIDGLPDGRGDEEYPPARINIAMDGAVHTPLPRRVNCVDYGLNGIGPQHLRSRLLAEPKRTAVESISGQSMGLPLRREIGHRPLTPQTLG
jgi:hypothetical protein